MKRLWLAGLALLLLSGCGGTPAPKTSQEDHHQTIMVNTPGVEDAMCIVQNGAGSWNIHAPGPVTLPRSPATLNINCFKGEHLRGSTRVAASFAPVEAEKWDDCVSCRYPGIVNVALMLNNSLMEVPVLRVQQ
jgi:hypothetical protein